MASGQTMCAFLPAQNEPPNTNAATPDLRNAHPTLDFDTTTQETAIFSDGMPRNYGGGNLVVYLTWAASTATTGTGGWDVTFERVGNTQDIDSDGFATAQTVVAATVPATSGQPLTTSVTCTAGAAGTDSIAAGELFRLRVRRDVANDTAAGDLELLLVEIKEA